jgi:hypothetical protein
MQKIKGLREAAMVQAQAKADVLKTKAAAARTRAS